MKLILETNEVKRNVVTRQKCNNCLFVLIATSGSAALRSTITDVSV